MESNIINLTNTQQDNPNLVEDFNTYLVVKDKGFNPNIPANIHFFEWSDINQERLFDDHDKFLKWLWNDCKIYSKWDEDKKVKELAHTTSGVWIICREGTHQLVIEDTLDNMKKVLAQTPRTTVTQTSYTPPRYPQYAPCCYGDYYEDDWD